MSGQLFTHYFLEEGIRETDAWKKVLDSKEAFAAFRFRSFSIRQQIYFGGA